MDQALVIKVDKKALALAIDEELSGSVEEIAEGEFRFSKRQLVPHLMLAQNCPKMRLDS